MTTLVALSTKDAIVMGCDSLASETHPFVSVYDLVEFFDINNNFNLKLNKRGKPLLKNFDQIYNITQPIPYDHMTHVSKLFSLYPLEMGVMMAGIVSIGDRTVKNLIAEFKKSDPAFNVKSRTTNYTVNSVATRLLQFIMSYYDREHQPDRAKPELELIIAGYDKRKQIPSILRIKVHENKIEPTVNDFGIVFGAQMREIQRIVFGTDPTNKIKIAIRGEKLLEKYHRLLSKHLKANNISINLPRPSVYANKLFFFDNWDLDGFEADWDDFSEQNAIECVDFFTNIMIKSQQFSSRLPTVGGEVHIALITKSEGFKFISREELRHGEHIVEISGGP